MTDRQTKTSANDRERLRTLAGRYSEIFNSDEMNRRREAWRLTNGLKERTVPFQIEDNGTFFDDVLPELECEGKVERNFEKQMLRAITNYELIPDDRIFSPLFNVKMDIHQPGDEELCPEFDRIRGDDGHGGSLGFRTTRPLADLPNSLHKLQRKPFTVDRELTMAKVERAESIFGDLLPVATVNNSIVWSGCGMASQAVNWIGMENLFMMMMDEPESVHAFFDFVATERCDYFDWLEKEGLLVLNNKEVDIGSGSCGYTDDLPKREIGPDDSLCYDDLWGFQESQEATGISPDMFEEFIFPVQKRVSDRFGLVYYGCCEPVHKLYPVIKGLTNVRKITVSPWCDQDSIAEQVGKNVVMSRKPHPMQLCGESFDANSFTEHIQETLTASRDNFVELIFRDTCTLSGGMKERLVEACGIIRKLIDSQ